MEVVGSTAYIKSVMRMHSATLWKATVVLTTYTTEMAKSEVAEILLNIESFKRVDSMENAMIMMVGMMVLNKK